MLEKILELERGVFLWINGTHTPFLDRLFWSFSGVLIWFPLILIPLYFLWKRKENWIPAIISLVLIPVLCTIASNHVFKPIFTRFRPTTHPAFMDVVTLLNDYTAGGLYGFISGHTTNAFGFAVLSILLVRNKFYTVFISIVGLFDGLFTNLFRCSFYFRCYRWLYSGNFASNSCLYFL